jgi:hypothetical protein
MRILLEQETKLWRNLRKAHRRRENNGMSTETFDMLALYSVWWRDTPAVQFIKGL